MRVPGSSVSWFGEDSQQLTSNDRRLSFDDFKSAVIYSGTIEQLVGGSKGCWSFSVNYGRETKLSTAHLNVDNPIPFVGKGCLACMNVCSVPILMTYNAETLVAPLTKCPNGLLLA